MMAYHHYAISGRKIVKPSGNYTSYKSKPGPGHGQDMPGIKTEKTLDGFRVNKERREL
jgi:hypothetical protein